MILKIYRKYVAFCDICNRETEQFDSWHDCKDFINSEKWSTCWNKETKEWKNFCPECKNLVQLKEGLRKNEKYSLKKLSVLRCSAFVSLFKYPDGSSAYSVVCMHDDNCYLSHAIEADFETESEAVDAWNNRNISEEADY